MTADAAALARARLALLVGNLVIGSGLMVAPGSLNDLARALGVSIAVGGQLVAVGAATVCFAAPLCAGWVAGFDRRRLLAATMLFYGAGHLACALMPSFDALLPVRALTLVGAAVFTPQAAAAIGHMAPPAERGRAITTIFLGWSIASVLGLPAAAWIGDALGWRAAYATIGVLALPVALWVYAVLPDGVRPPALTLADWRRALADRRLMAMVAVTFLFGLGQFTLFTYLPALQRQVLGQSTLESTLLLVWFGVFGIVGNVLVTRRIDRYGADRSVTFTVALIALAMLLWPLVQGPVAFALICLPWALGCFSSNSAQQARLSAAAPSLAAALLALNTSAIYLGQAAGAASGGWLIGHVGWHSLSWAALAWLLASLGASAWVSSTRPLEAAR